MCVFSNTHYQQRNHFLRFEHSGFEINRIEPLKNIFTSAYSRSQAMYNFYIRTMLLRAPKHREFLLVDQEVRSLKWLLLVLGFDVFLKFAAYLGACSLLSKRFRGVWDQRTGFFWCFTLQFFAPKPHRNACYAGLDACSNRTIQSVS